jgi:signal transduction histidine kinase
MNAATRIDRVFQRRPMLITIGIALVAFLLLLAAKRWMSGREDLAAGIRVQAAIIGTNASAAIVFDDARTASEMLGALDRSPTVLEAALYKEDGSVLATYLKPGVEGTAQLARHAAAPGVAFGLSELQLTMPVVLDQREIGRVAIRATQRYLFEELGNYMLAQLVALLIAATLADLATGRLRQRFSLARDQLETSRSMLLQLQARRETLLEEEHRRIAIEIHDQLGQVLTAALLNLRLLERSAGQSDADRMQLVRDIESQLNDAYQGMKNIAANLHPVVLQFGLVTAIEWLGERILAPAGVKLHIEGRNAKLPLDARQSLALFRIAQEAFTNTVRHALATEVRVAISGGAGRFRLEIADNGLGFDKKASSSELHFGLLGIRQRADSIGARVVIDSAPGSGTVIRVAFADADPTQDIEEGMT